MGQLYQYDAVNTIIDLPPNSPPVADAGTNRTIFVGAQIQLDGSGSSDPEMAALSYSWSVLTAPSGSVAGLSAYTIVNPLFIADLLFAHDLDDPVVNFELLQGPTGMTLSVGGFISWLPDALGDFPVAIKVSDPRGAYIVMSYEARVLSQPNQPPQIISTPNLFAGVNTPYAYDVQATDPETLPLVFVLDLAPAGMNIDSETGLIQWIPGLADIGMYTVAVSAVDFFGVGVTQAYALTVTDQAVFDLEATRIDAGEVVIDPQTLAISSNLKVDVTNVGTEGLAQPFKVTVFEDSDFDQLFTPGVDNVLGEQILPGVLAPGLQYNLSIPLSGTVLFRDNLLYVLVDSTNGVSEFDETNNLKNTFFDCGTNCLDLSVSYLRVNKNALPTNTALTVRLGNGGEVAVPAGVNVAFYDADPGLGGNLIGVVQSTNLLNPGHFEDVSVVWAAPIITNYTVFVMADDNGAGVAAYAETDEANNVLTSTVELRANDPPVADAGPDRNVFVDLQVGLNGIGSSDPEGQPLSYQWRMVSIPVGSLIQLSGAGAVVPTLTPDVPGRLRRRIGGP